MMRFIAMALLATLIGAAGGSWAFGGHTQRYSYAPMTGAIGDATGDEMQR